MYKESTDPEADSHRPPQQELEGGLYQSIRDGYLLQEYQIWLQQEEWDQSTPPKGEAMLDAAEEILREEGYAALTSRKVAEHLGVKQRLIYYYFRTMDDLMLETFKRLSGRELDRLKRAISSDHPLHEVWSVCINTSDARLVSEFMALANRSERVRKEVVSFIEQARKLQITALKKTMLKNNTGSESLQPEVIAFIGTSLALALNREASLGIKKGHLAVDRMIKQFFDRIEP